jgi:hypothetical protein
MVGNDYAQNAHRSEARGEWTAQACAIACSIKGNVKNIFLPPPDAQVYFATSSPLPPEKTLVWCHALGFSISAAASLLGSDDANQFRN